MVMEHIMNENIKKEKLVEYIIDGDTVKIYAEEVTKQMIEEILLLKNIKRVKLTKFVKFIGGGAFQGLDFLKTKYFDFSNAKLEKLGCLAFYDCDNIYFGEYFSGVREIGKYSFANSNTKSKTSLDLRNVKVLPSGCFLNAEIDYLNLAGVESVGEDALKNLKVTAINLSDSIYDEYMNASQDEEGSKIQ